MLLTKAAIADSHFICTVPSHVGRVESFPSVQVTSLSPLKVNPVSQVTVYLLPEAIVADVGVTVPSEIVGLLHGLGLLEQVGKVDSTPFVQVTSLFPLKVNPLSQVTVYLLPEAIVAEVGVTVASEIVGLLQELAENTILLR